MTYNIIPKANLNRVGILCGPVERNRSRVSFGLAPRMRTRCILGDIHLECST